MRKLRSPLKIVLVEALISLAAVSLFGSSYYPNKLHDPKAIYLTRENFPVHGDGIGDDTDAVQQAIN